MGDIVEPDDPYAGFHAVLHGRARHEREDSVTLSILQDRLSHLNRCKALEPTPELKSGAEKLVHIGLGSKMRLKGTYEPLATGAGGHGTHMASVTRDWPIFQHLLPEIAFAGHSNSGKSTLVNALIGVSPRLGPANVSDRAGWTDAISFYQLGKRPPIVTIVDFPGYGHAVASKAEKQMWTRMIDAYLGDRPILSRCCVLVDSTRGLCAADKRFIRSLNRHKVAWAVIATKGDLLGADLLQRSLTVIKSDLEPFLKSSTMTKHPLGEDAKEGLVFPVSAATGAGVNHFWKSVVRWVDASATPIVGPASVREHQRALELRRSASNKVHSKGTVKLSRTLLRALK